MLITQMKNIRKIATIVVAFALVLSIAIVPASAAKEDVYTINIDSTIENADTIDITSTIENTHVCTIVKANENRHIVDCDECGSYERVNHDELEATAKTEFFHEFKCNCGYAYSESHNFDTSFDQNGHQEICVDCGYAKEKVDHIFVDEYYDSYHDIVCIDCGYMSAHHVGVIFTTVDDANCFANCKQCGTSCSIAHDFYGFTCDNCEFVLGGITYAIVEDIREYEDGTYRVRFMSNGNTHRVTMENVDGFNEGDFVEINHCGNEIFDITVIIDGGVIENPEAFMYYICSEKILESNEGKLVLEDITIDEIEYSEEYVDISYESVNRFMHINTDYVVYDLIDGEMSELTEGFAYLTFAANGKMYFICIW